MANHSSIHSSEPLSFSAMYRLQSQGQRSNSLFQNGSVSRISHYEDNSNLLADVADNCATAGPSINGVDDHLNSAYWDMESFVSSQPVELSRTKTFTGAYDEKWSSSSQQQDAVEGYVATGGNQQKLDSFSEAFYGRAISKITSGGEQVGYNVHSNNSPPNPTIHSLSFPLVLSPPPTPLPPSSLSPPKQGSHLPVTQSLNQGQSQSPSEGPLRFFPLNCCSPTLPASFPTTHWLSLPTDVNGNREATQHLSQDPSPSSIYPGGVGIHLRQLSVTERDTDCSLDTSPCSPLVQQAPAPSIPKPEQEQGPVTSEHHMTWSQMMLSSQPFGTPLHPSQTQTEELKTCDDTKTSFGFQRTHLLFSSSQSTPSVTYTGVPFHSVLQLGVLGNDLDQLIPHYTPSPMLNPNRNGTGLFCNLLSPINKEIWSEETWPNAQERHVNIGPEFQAELPDLLDVKDINMWKEPLREDLLWKPWAELEQSEVLQERVENLLDLSASTALPGCAANLELALHSLSLCQGKILAALDIMFFSNSTPSRDYHYTGRDVWLLSEQKLFRKAFAIYGKDFSLIHKMVKTKQVSQCVEFYYHSKKLAEKQSKQKEKEKQEHQQQQIDAETLTHTNQIMMTSKIMMNPMNVNRLIHTPSLASHFPCKQCGKMFYKIKSRNAHMKIHRQQQEDWRERIHATNHLSLTHALQNQNRTLSHPPSQLVTQSHPNQMLSQSIQNLVQAQAQLAFIQSGKTQSACFTGINSMSSTQNPETAPKATALPIYTGHQQTWGALHGSLESSLYYD